MNYITYIAISLIVVFMLWQFLPFYRARQMCGRSAPNIENLLNDKQKAYSSLLIYFWSPQCVMCKGMSKIIDEHATTHDNILKVDVMQNITLTSAFGVMGTPSIVLLIDDKIKNILVGKKNNNQITEFLRSDIIKIRVR